MHRRGKAWGWKSPSRLAHESTHRLCSRLPSSSDLETHRRCWKTSCLNSAALVLSFSVQTRGVTFHTCGRGGGRERTGAPAGLSLHPGLATEDESRDPWYTR
eukprot:scaffold76379_cov28-Tisochrysis_lutea.AAC.1